jgi:hypothetical protein
MYRTLHIALGIAAAVGCSGGGGPSILETPDATTSVDGGVPPEMETLRDTSGSGDASTEDTASDEMGRDAGADVGDDPYAPCEDDGDAARLVLWDDAGIAVSESRTGSDYTSGVAVADLDGDDAPDILTTSPIGQPVLLRNDGAGNFDDVTGEAGLDALLPGSTGIAVADVEGDGDTDVFLGRTDGQYLLINDGSGHFSEESAARGLDASGLVVTSAAFADYDGDGDLDLYVGTWADVGGGGLVGQPNQLYRNDDGQFTLVPDGPASDGAPTHAVAWLDYDGDDDPDLVVGNDFGPQTIPNQLFRNDDGAFVDVAPSVDFDRAVFSMSATVGDVDNDLDLDVYLTNFGFNLLHIADGGSFSEEAVARGAAVGHLPDPMPRPATGPDFSATQPGMEAFIADYTDPRREQYVLTSWAAVFFDANHDGWQDLWVVNGQLPTDLLPEAPNQPNYLLHNQGDGTFAQGPCWYWPDVRGSTRGSAVGDLDRDGDLDIVFAETGIGGGEPGLVALRNDDGTGNWLIVDLEGAAPNTDAIGATVTIDAGGMRQLRHIDGGQSFLSVSERIAHFGLADTTTIDSVEVRWPDGSTTTRTEVDANQRLRLTQE